MGRLDKALKKAVELREKPVHPEEPEEHGGKRFDATSMEALERLREVPMLVSANAVHSPAAEEFRKLKQNLVRVTQKEGFQNTLLVTSGTTSEGKSVTAANLAVSLAQEFDHTVLLVDADLRRPTCHTLLQVEPGIGLADCLVNGTDVSEAIVRVGLGKLSFLPAGSNVPNPGELLASGRMRKLLREMKHRYPDRYIIVDTPPVLPFAESRSLARIVDGVVLVIKQGRMTRNSLQEVFEALRGANILGAVYNQAAQGGGNGYYGYGGYGAYGYGY
ncbi:XrtA-associated tyrosine autokinase [Salidesulfovibrio brasiliensis]